MKTIDRQKAKFFSDYNNYLPACSKIRKLQKTDFNTIQRMVSPCCKTVNTANKVLVLKFKENKYGISITKLPQQIHDTVPYYLILGFPFNINYTVSADNMHELMHKINHSYNLIKPDIMHITEL
jgi:hypothetical protein